MSRFKRTLALPPRNSRFRGPPVSSGPTYLMYDTFTDSDGVLLTAHKPDVGGPWVAALGTWSITSGQAYVSTSGGTNDMIYTDVGKSDYTIYLDFMVNLNTNARLLFRYTDISNHFYINTSGTSYSLNRRQSGAVTTIASGGARVDGDKFKVVLSGSSILVYLNGALLFSTTDTFNQTATKAGMANYANTTARFDNFKVGA